MIDLTEYLTIIFLDIDGVFQSNEYYERVKDEDLIDYDARHIMREKVELFNTIANNPNTFVVISSTWRNSNTIEELQKLFDKFGGKFKIIDITPTTKERIRGVEIYLWIKANIDKYYNFHRYIIIDDDSDMMLWQANNFFKTETEFGLTETICYKISRFLQKTRNVLYD